MEINKKQLNIREVYVIIRTLQSNELLITSMQSETTPKDDSRRNHCIGKVCKSQPIQPLGWSVSSCLPNLTSLYRGFHWVQSCTLSR